MIWPYFYSFCLHVTLLSSLIIVSCESKRSIRTYRLPKKTNKVFSQKIKDNNKKFALKYTRPESWVEFSGHSMRLASFYAHYNGGKGEVSVTEFSGISGGIEANINRWRKQLFLPPESLDNIFKSSSELKGELSDFRYFELVNESTKQAILASIFQLKNRTVFVKLSIDQSGINSVTEDFLSFSKSISEK